MKFFITIVLAICILFAQLFLAPLIQIFNAKPDFIIIFIFCTSFFSGEVSTPIALGLYIGIALDSTTQGITYINTGIYLALAVIAAVFAKIVISKSLTLTMSSVAFAMLLKYFILIFVLYAVKIQSKPSLMVFIAGLPSVAYTVFASIAVYYLLRAIYKFKSMQPNKDESGIFIGG